MKKYIFLIQMILFSSLLFNACGENNKETEGSGYDAANSPAKDQSIQSYNLDVQKDQSASRTPCDTLALREYVLSNYPKGSYLVQFDRSQTFNVPKSAVIYFKSDVNYVFALIARSKDGERSIEAKNITGYNSSFVNLDSTKLGTAFFYLTLFSCDGGQFQMVWEKAIPMHGGFNKMTLNTWRPKNIMFVRTDFEDGIIVGHRDYNVFMVDGLRNPPHLLETYEGISRKRTMADVNHDKFPDYYEFFFYDLSNKIAPVDSVAFLWDLKKNLYVNTRNPRQTREY